MAVKHYQPQLLRCDFFVDTTNAVLWVPPHMREMLKAFGFRLTTIKFWNVSLS